MDPLKRRRRLKGVVNIPVRRVREPEPSAPRENAGETSPTSEVSNIADSSKSVLPISEQEVTANRDSPPRHAGTSVPHHRSNMPSTYSTQKMEMERRRKDGKERIMRDLIYDTNTVEKVLKKNRCEKPRHSPGEGDDGIALCLAEESVDDVISITETRTAMPAPQVKVGPDGTLIIDPESLLIETTGSKKPLGELANPDVVIEYGEGNNTTENSFRKRAEKAIRWTRNETREFNRIVEDVGYGDYMQIERRVQESGNIRDRPYKDIKKKYTTERRRQKDSMDKAEPNFSLKKQRFLGAESAGPSGSVVSAAMASPSGTVDYAVAGTSANTQAQAPLRRDQIPGLSLADHNNSSSADEGETATRPRYGHFAQRSESSDDDGK